MAWSVISGLQNKPGPSVSRQEGINSGFSIGLNIAGLKVWQVLSVINSSGELRSKGWYLAGCLPIS